MPTFHTPCFEERSLMRRTEVVVGAVDSVDCGRIRCSGGVVPWGWPGGVSRMNIRRLWRFSGCPRFILERSSSCSTGFTRLFTHVHEIVDSSRNPRGLHTDSSRIPQGLIRTLPWSTAVRKPAWGNCVIRPVRELAEAATPTCAQIGGQTGGFLEDSTRIPRGIHSPQKSTAPGQGRCSGVDAAQRERCLIRAVSSCTWS